MELFFIIATYEKILDVKIVLSKLIKKVLLNENSPCYGEKSLYKLCQILLKKKKNKTIENIFNDIIIKEIDDKNDKIYNNFCLKFKDKDKVFIGTNNYFIKEFNIDYQEEKPKKAEIDELIEENGKKEDIKIEFKKVKKQNNNYDEDLNNINNDININNININNIENENDI